MAERIFNFIPTRIVISITIEHADLVSVCVFIVFKSFKILLRSILKEKSPLTRWTSRSVARRICPLSADKFHTYSPICVFRFVHAGAKNELNFISSLRTKLCEAFFDNLGNRRASARPFCLGRNLPDKREFIIASISAEMLYRLTATRFQGKPTKVFPETLSFSNCGGKSIR